MIVNAHMATDASSQPGSLPAGVAPDNDRDGDEDGGQNNGNATTAMTTSGGDDGDAQLLRRVCLEYAATLLRKDTAAAAAADGDADDGGSKVATAAAAQPAAASARAVARLRELVGKSSAQAWELQSVLESAENDVAVTEALLTQLRVNAQQLANTFRLVDSLCHVVQRVEQATMATRQQCREVQAAYDARHPKSMQRFLGSINVFRSKKTAEVQRPPMPGWHPLETPLDVDAEFLSLRQQAWATPVKTRSEGGSKDISGGSATASDANGGVGADDSAAGGGGDGGDVVAREEQQGVPKQTLTAAAAAAAGGS